MDSIHCGGYLLVCLRDGSEAHNMPMFITEEPSHKHNVKDEATEIEEANIDLMKEEDQEDYEVEDKAMV